jgi:FkbM family methyltransferase
MQTPSLQNVALGKPVTDGPDFGPSWQVDLGGEHLVRTVVVHYGRELGARLRRLRILTSRDGRRWRTVFRGLDGDSPAPGEPFVAGIEEGPIARHVRVQMDASDWIYFGPCEVLGAAPDAASLERVSSEDAMADGVARGRDGHFAAVGDHEIFIDRGRYSARMVAELSDPAFEQSSRNLVRRVVGYRDRVIELGTAVGVTAMAAASLVGPDNVVSFEANPRLIEDARGNFARNGLGAIGLRNGVLRNRARFVPGDRAELHVHRDFWASRLASGPPGEDVVEVVHVPVFCLEDEIAAHRADVLVCNIEGGEVELLTDADLSPIRVLVLETHYWAAGVAPTDAMIRKLVLSGFNIDLAISGNQRLALRR